jgi:hypothetical protein
VGRTTSAAASGLESLWTARLMWALGVNFVRGGDKCDETDYSRSDLSHLVQFLRHYLSDVSRDEIEKRLCAELQGNAFGMHMCQNCKKTEAHRGVLCPACFFKESLCGRCGQRGHVEKWCGRLVSPAEPSSQHATPTPNFKDDIDDNLLIRALEAAEAKFEAESRRPTRSHSSLPTCLDCEKPVPGDRPRCYECWLAKTPCFFCMKKGHKQRDCPQRMATPVGVKRKWCERVV